MYLNRAQLVIPYSSWITSDFWFMKIMTFYFLKSLSELDSNKPHSESVIGSFIKYFCLNDRKKGLFRESIKLPPLWKIKVIYEIWYVVPSIVKFQLSKAGPTAYCTSIFGLAWSKCGWKISEATFFGHPVHEEHSSTRWSDIILGTQTKLIAGWGFRSSLMY